MKQALAMVLLGLALLKPLSAEAQLTAQAESEIKKIIAGGHFLRIDLPLWYAWATAGDWTEAVVEVSPAGIDFARRGTTSPWPGDGYMTSKFWGLGPNEPVQYATVEFESGAIVLWFEGAKPKDDLQAKVRFVRMRTLDDFQTAFSRVFSKVALQDEHPEWAEEIKQAIAQRKVIKGMTTLQAACVVGKPVAVVPTMEKGVAGEVWVTRQENGTLFKPFKTVLTGFPPTLKFVGGILQEIAGGESK